MEGPAQVGGWNAPVGVLASAGMFALDHHVDRLREDHRRARTLAAGAAEIFGLSVRPPDTNIVMLDIEAPGISPQALLELLAGKGVLMVPFGPDRLRAVTHMDVDDAGIERALVALGEAMAEGLARSGR